MDDPVAEWGNDLRSYQENRKHIGYVSAPQYNSRVTHNAVRQQETSYNPILQQYTDPARETTTKSREHVQAREQLAKNKVRLTIHAPRTARCVTSSTSTS